MLSSQHLQEYNRQVVYPCLCLQEVVFLNTVLFVESPVVPVHTKKHFSDLSTLEGAVFEKLHVKNARLVLRGGQNICFSCSSTNGKLNL